MNWNFDCLWQFVTKQFRSPKYSVHGPEHWRRVERNGLLLATRSGADIAVVRLFALFHDSRRQNDGRDDGHGTRGAEYAKTLHGVAYDLSNDRFELLYYACVWHTDGEHHDDPTIGSIEPFIQSTANVHPPPTLNHGAVRRKRTGQT
jgi:uncharacterized protein